MTAVDVAMVLGGAWAIAGVFALVRNARPLGWLALGGAAAGVAGLVGGRVAADVAGPLVIALSVHLLVALPAGHLGSDARRRAVGALYVAAAGAAAALVAGSGSFRAAPAAVAWVVAGTGGLLAARHRYSGSAGRDREQLQWEASGFVLAGMAVLVAAVLHVLVGWPAGIGAVAAAGTVFLPAGLIAANVKRGAAGGFAGRVLVQALSVGGFAFAVSGIYLLVVLGLGRAPTSNSDREALGLSMLAAAIAAVGYVPARGRLVASATRFVYGAREAPDEIMRTFGNRLTRAIPMEELLTQLAESLRKSMRLTSAEVYTGAGEVLERTVCLPHAGPKPILISPKEREVIAQAAVSGNAWASVWLPALLDDREHAQIRVAPVRSSGELLGLLVVERPAHDDVFTELEDRVLADLAREVGLAFHNSQLDAALQTTLDELRKQADDLRESHARIVASGDAERRKVERNLHDGAQQRLVALAVGLRLTRDLVNDDPAAAGEMLEDLVTQTQETIQELRDLAHGIYPPLLMDAGLAAALKAAASRSPLDVEVIADDLGRHSSEVEAAVYFCCLEAMQNAAKHAPDATVEVRVWEESGGLLFAVTDDGPGFDVDTAIKGHGFVNMADRLGAIGGAVRWESELGSGSTIKGTVPLVS